MTRASEAVKRAFQLLALFVAVLTSATGALPAVDPAAAAPVAAHFSTQTALPEASPDLRLEPADQQRDDCDDGPAGDWLANGLPAAAPAARDRGAVSRFTIAAPLSEHEAAFHQARAPPAI